MTHCLVHHADLQLAAVHLSDAHYITDAPKFISVVLLALRAMLQLELPHINVLSKIDLLSTYGELREFFPLLFISGHQLTIPSIRSPLLY